MTLPTRVLIFAFGVFGGGVFVWVNSYPAFEATPSGIVAAFFWAFTVCVLGGILVAWMVGEAWNRVRAHWAKANRDIDAAIAETFEIRGVDHLVSTVRRERGRVYSAEYVHDRAGKRAGSRRAS